MDCREAREAQLRGEMERAQAHFDECDACRELHRDGELSESLMADQPTTFDTGTALQSLKKQINSRETAWDRAQQLPTAQRLALLFLVASLIVLYVLLFRMRADLSIYPQPRLTAEMTILIVLTGTLAWSLLRPLSLPAWSPRGTAILLALCALSPWLLVALPQAHEAHPLSGRGRIRFRRPRDALLPIRFWARFAARPCFGRTDPTGRDDPCPSGLRPELSALSRCISIARSPMPHT